MHLTNLREAPLIWASSLLSQETNQKMVKDIQSEINHVSPYISLSLLIHTTLIIFLYIDVKNIWNRF
jgi:hypothetical protein